MDLAHAEARPRITLPERHRQAMQDASDPVHEWCDFLVPESLHSLLRWVEVNELLHAADSLSCWPSFLVAFASNGCGDYFAYDLRSKPSGVVYVDPDDTIEENLTAEDRLVYGSFEEWYESRRRHRSS
jgi:hypothetical protein